MKIFVAGGGVGGLFAAISLHAAGFTDVRWSLLLPGERLASRGRIGVTDGHGRPRTRTGARTGTRT